MSFFRDVMKYAGPAIGASLQTAGVPGAESTFNNISNQIANKDAQNLSFKQSKEMAKYQSDLQKDLFDYVNAYNTPANQRQRLEEGGYNPALMYGNSMQGNSNTAMPSSPNSAISRFQAYQHSLLTQAQVENIQADTKKKESEAENIDQQTANDKIRESILNLDKQDREILLDIATATKETKIQYSIAETAKLQNEGQVVLMQADLLFFEAGLTKAQTAKVWQELANLKITEEMLKTEAGLKAFRAEIEKELSYFGQPCVQTLLDLGLDFVADLVGFAKLFKHVDKIPEIIGKSTDTYSVGPKGSTHTTSTTRNIYR